MSAQDGQEVSISGSLTDVLIQAADLMYLKRVMDQYIFKVEGVGTDRAATVRERSLTVAALIGLSAGLLCMRRTC